MKRAIVLAVVAVQIVWVAAASAHRPATPSDLSGMVYHASGRYYGNAHVNEPSSVPARCFKAVTSTVTKGSTWGAWTFSDYAYQRGHSRQCDTGNGWAVEHKIRGRWYVLWEGSDAYPPTHSTKDGSHTLQGVPRAVAKDLKAGLD